MSGDPIKSAAPLAGGARANSKVGPVQDMRSLPLIVPPAHHNAPKGTSDVAATRMIGAAGGLRAAVLAHVAGSGERGTTDEEGGTVLGLKQQTYTPRRRELVLMGLVIDSGRRRHTSSKRPAAVWVAASWANAQRGGAE